MKSLTILQELGARLKSKSPRLFEIISYISMLCGFISGLPQLLILLKLSLPNWALSLQSKTVFVASVISLIISKLTVDTPEATAQVLESKIIKDENKEI